MQLGIFVSGVGGKFVCGAVHIDKLSCIDGDFSVCNQSRFGNLFDISEAIIKSPMEVAHGSYISGTTIYVKWTV